MYKTLTLIFAVSIFVVGCDSTGITPPPEDGSTSGEGENEVQRDTSGAYTTDTFIAYPEETGDTIRVAEGGGFIRLTLHADDSVSGRMFIPEAYRGTGEPDAEGDYDVRIGGTYHTSGDSVFFDHEADTFIRDVPWIWRNDTLRAQEYPGTVVLTKESDE